MADYAIDSYTKLLLHADGADESTTFTDSATGKAVTPVGTAQVDTAQKKFGSGSLLVDGDSDYLTLLDHADWSFGTGNFTIESWFRTTNNALGAGFVGQYVDASNRWICYKVITATGGYLGFFATIGASVKAHYYSGNIEATLTSNEQHHLAWVRNGTAILIFLDGTSLELTVSTAVGANDFGNLAGLLYIGYDQGTPQFANGWLDEVRISKGIARWTANFTPPSRAYGSSAPGGFSGGQPWIFMKDMWEKHNKIFRPKRGILIPGLT